MYRAGNGNGIGSRSSRADLRAAARPAGLSGFDVLAWGGQYFVRDPRARLASGSWLGDAGRGLGRVERKAEGPGFRGGTAGKVDSFTTVWISGLFALVFLMGCLTLA
jgi:hypothetical protein